MVSKLTLYRQTEEKILAAAKKYGLHYDCVIFLPNKNFDYLVKYWAVNKFYDPVDGYEWVQIGEDEDTAAIIATIIGG